MFILALFACIQERAPRRTLVEDVGTVADQAVVWNGFSQVWGYNHRINSYEAIVHAQPEWVSFDA